MGFLQWREKWNSIPNTAWASGNLQGRGSVNGKLLRENKAKGSSGEINLAGFLLKKSQDDQTSPGEWWKMENLIIY